MSSNDPIHIEDVSHDAARSAHFLLVTWEGGGTIPPELGVARQLIEAGHRVTVLADPTVDGAATAIGAAFIPWTTAPHRTSFAADDDAIRDWEQTNPIAMLKNLRDRFLVDPARRFCAETSSAIELVRPDAVLVDYLLLGPIAAAQSAELPVGVLMPNIWVLPTPGVPAFGPGFAPARTIVGRARDALFRRVTTRLFNARLDDFNTVRADLDLPPLSDLWDQVRRADRIIVLTSPTFDFAASRAPDNAVFAGPILDEPRWAHDLELPWSSTDARPLVLVALSSTYQAQEDLLRRIVAALEQRDLRAVVTVGPMLDPTDFATSSADVVITQTAPHGPILEQASAVITHCGHGTTLKALAEGLPVLCVPMGRDQDDTAARVVHAGAGIRIKPKVSSQIIGEKLDLLLSTPGYAAQANALARTIEAERSAVNLAEECESLLARRRGVSRSRS